MVWHSCYRGGGLRYRCGADVSFLAEKLGSDALRITAPVNWARLDPGLRTDVEAPSDRQDVEFDFTCELIEVCQARAWSSSVDIILEAFALGIGTRRTQWILWKH